MTDSMLYLRRPGDDTQPTRARTKLLNGQMLAHYGGGVWRIAVDALTDTAQALSTSVEEQLGTQAKRSAGKRGPQPKIAQQLQQIEAISRSSSGL